LIAPKVFSKFFGSGEDDGITGRGGDSGFGGKGLSGRDSGRGTRLTGGGVRSRERRRAGGVPSSLSGEVLRGAVGMTTLGDVGDFGRRGRVATVFEELRFVGVSSLVALPLRDD
jgi:hypothetical protein